MEIYRKYTFHRPESLPVEPNLSANYPDDEILLALGWEPEDEELGFYQLSRPWNGHKKGAAVIAGLFVEGHSFAVENTDNEAF